MPIFKSSSKIIYFSHIPKTGGSSIENMLSSFKDIEIALHSPKIKKITPVSPQHLHDEYLNKLFPDSFFDWEFCLVRNPYSRLVSEYNMKRKEAGLKFGPFVRQCFKRFQRFPQTRDNHIRPQVDFPSKNSAIYKLEDGLEKPLVDALVNLQVEYSNLDKILRHDRKSKQAKPYKISRQLQDLIANFYRDDFINYGYDPKVLPASLELKSLLISL